MSFEREKLVSEFMELKDYWYTDKKNGYYGMEQYHKAHFNYWIEKGEHLDYEGIHHSFIYLNNKFIEFLEIRKVMTVKEYCEKNSISISAVRDWMVERSSPHLYSSTIEIDCKKYYGNGRTSDEAIINLGNQIIG